MNTTMSTTDHAHLSPTTTPSIPPDPLAHPGVIRIILEPGQAAPFPAIGETFVCLGPGSWPEAPGRSVLYLVPVDRERLRDAQRIIVGTHRAAKIKTPKP